jgi:GntR family transcriptional regulator, transcriptional repressor for pyruvate dehydrogenase complex
VRKQTHKDLKMIVVAIAERNGKRAEELVSDHLMRTLATINIWQ